VRPRVSHDDTAALHNLLVVEAFFVSSNGVVVWTACMSFGTAKPASYITMNKPLATDVLGRFKTRSIFIRCGSLARSVHMNVYLNIHEGLEVMQMETLEAHDMTVHRLQSAYTRVDDNGKIHRQ